MGDGEVTRFSEVKEHGTKSDKYIYLWGQRGRVSNIELLENPVFTKQCP